jgi:hypothetical protein
LRCMMLSVEQRAGCQLLKNHIVSEDSNPYTAPKASLELQRDDCWREGNLFAVRRDSTCPMRCVKCNQVTEKKAPLKLYFWRHPIWYVSLVVHVCSYVLLEWAWLFLGSIIAVLLSELLLRKKFCLTQICARVTETSAGSSIQHFLLR